MADSPYSVDSSSSAWSEEHSPSALATPRNRNESSVTQATPASFRGSLSLAEGKSAPDAFETPTRPRIMRAAKANLRESTYKEWDGMVSEESSDNEGMDIDAQDDPFVTASRAPTSENLFTDSQTSSRTPVVVVQPRQQHFQHEPRPLEEPRTIRSEQAQRMELGLSEFQQSPRRIIPFGPREVKNWGGFQPLLKDMATQTEVIHLNDPESTSEFNISNAQAESATQTETEGLNGQDGVMEQDGQDGNSASLGGEIETDELYQDLLQRHEQPLFSTTSPNDAAIERNEAYFETAISIWSARVDQARRQNQKYSLAIALKYEQENKDVLEKLVRIRTERDAPPSTCTEGATLPGRVGRASPQL